MLINWLSDINERILDISPDMAMQLQQEMFLLMQKVSNYQLNDEQKQELDNLYQ